MIPQYPPGHDLLQGKVVVVTAAAGTGIGSAVAKRCLEEGAQVVISDWHERRLKEKAAELGEVHAIPCDVTQEDQVQALIDGAVAHFGRVDVMVNNAGLGGTKSVIDMTDDEWSRVLDITLGVRINAVAPSLAMHPFLAKVTSDELLDDLTKREAFGRAAEPWEVANVMVFLASDYASYLTGEVVSVSSQHP